MRDPRFVEKVLDQPFDEVYQLAADMGGAGFIFSGENDADIMHNSAMINLNVMEASVKAGVKKNLGWAPNWSLRKGMEITYRWISRQVEKRQLLVDD